MKREVIIGLEKSGVYVISLVEDGVIKASTNSDLCGGAIVTRTIYDWIQHGIITPIK